jgi:hypothetical protein
MPSWVKYSLIRFGMFAAILAGLLLLQVHWLPASIIAAVAGFCVAYIFFRPQRDAVAHDLATRRRREAALPASDEDAEGDGAAEPATGRPDDSAGPRTPASEGEQRPDGESVDERRQH